MSTGIIKVVVLTLSCGLLSQLVACGTILHPERKGQISGQLDPKIVFFDAVGLLFFLVPGVIAFAVDFTNGTIYLPGGRHANLSPAELESITYKGKVDQAALSILLQQKGLTQADVNPETMQLKPVASVTELNKLLNTNRYGYAFR
jgi:hypothetical protein